MEYLQKGKDTLDEIITQPTVTIHYFVATKKYIKSKLKYEIDAEIRLAKLPKRKTMMNLIMEREREIAQQRENERQREIAQEREIARQREIEENNEIGKIKGNSNRIAERNKRLNRRVYEKKRLNERKKLSKIKGNSNRIAERNKRLNERTQRFKK